MDDRGTGAAAHPAPAPATPATPADSVPASGPAPTAASSPSRDIHHDDDHHGLSPHDAPDAPDADPVAAQVATDATATAAAAVAAAAAAASSTTPPTATAAAESATPPPAQEPAPDPTPDSAHEHPVPPPVSDLDPNHDLAPSRHDPAHQLEEAAAAIPDEPGDATTNGYPPAYPDHVHSSESAAVSDQHLHGADDAVLPSTSVDREPQPMPSVAENGELGPTGLSLSLSPASLAATAATATQQIEDHQQHQFEAHHENDGADGHPDVASHFSDLNADHTHDLAHHQLDQQPQEESLDAPIEHHQTQSQDAAHQAEAHHDGQASSQIHDPNHEQPHETYHDLQHGHSPLSAQLPQYEGDLTAISAPSADSMTASAAAHHGLQALQQGPSPAAQQSPQASLDMNTANALPQHYADTAHSASAQMGESEYATNGGHHQHQHHYGAPLAAGPGAANGHGALFVAGSASHKVTRLRRACDMCSTRKVKCDESGPPCKPCSDLGVDCTFARAMKRRGPPNKHAEAAKAAKRSRIEGSAGGVPMPGAGPSPIEHAQTDLVGSISPQTIPSATLDPQQHASQPQTHSAGQLELPQSQNQLQYDAESIAPMQVLQLLVDDFFTYIHPLMPFPHEPTFRHSFLSRADRSDRGFLALLASMIGILVASFPRSARSHLKASHSTDLFPTSIKMIDNCRTIALQARGCFFMANDDMTVDDAATSYFLALSAAYTLQWKACKRFMAETLTFCRETGSHRPKDANIQALTGDYEARPVNHITDQMSKRIFWVMVAGIRTMTQLGASINELPLPPPTSQEPYPDQPVEVDDEYIYADHILPQPDGVPSLITGFNRNIRVYTTMNELIGVDMCYGINFFDWRAQSNILSNGLIAAKQAIDDLPPELQVRTALGGLSDPGGFDYGGLQYHPPAFPATQPADDLRHVLAQQPSRRRQLQFEIQKANIYASGLATRSYFVERYLNLRDAHRSHHNGNVATTPTSPDHPKHSEEDERDAMVAAERELIVNNLLAVCGSISQRNMEPNGGSLIYKIRQVASTLLNDAPERKGPVAVKAEEYLGRFLDILMRLEKTGSGVGSGQGDMGGIDAGFATGALSGAGPGLGAGPGVGAGTMTPQDEEAELQCWASLREYQLQFAANGGFMAEM